MSNNILVQTELLRNQAWSDVINSPAYKAFKALDDAVASMGGKRMAEAALAPPKVSRASMLLREYTASGKRPSQADAAYLALGKAGEPLPIGRLLEATLAEGVEIGGDQIANLRSTVSKDARFYSLRRNNMYFWWLVKVPLPMGWDEAGSDDFSDLLGPASSSSGEEGGDGHGPPTT